MSRLRLLHNLSSDVDVSQYIIKFIRKILVQPDKVIKTISDFNEGCLYGKPTTAHYTVRNIVLLKNWQLLTENPDLLHQSSGMELLCYANIADKMDFSWLKENMRGQYIKEVDFIITAGLNSDEFWFLALYKSTTLREDNCNESYTAKTSWKW